MGTRVRSWPAGEPDETMRMVSWEVVALLLGLVDWR